MSYDLIFSIMPIPLNDEEAWEELEDREERNENSNPPKHPALIELIALLTKRYPCITELSDDELDDALWSDGPIIDNIIGDTATLSISPSKIESAFPYISEVAKKLELAIFDPQGGEIYRP